MLAKTNMTKLVVNNFTVTEIIVQISKINCKLPVNCFFNIICNSMFKFNQNIDYHDIWFNELYENNI